MQAVLLEKLNIYRLYKPEHNGGEYAAVNISKQKGGNEMYKVTTELARAVKYWLRVEEAAGAGAEKYKKAHAEFVEKMEEYERVEGISKEEAQENLLFAVESLRNER